MPGGGHRASAQTLVPGGDERLVRRTQLKTSRARQALRRRAAAQAWQTRLEPAARHPAPALTKAVEGHPFAQVRRRVAKLLKSLDPPFNDSELLRQFRAVEVSKRIGTPAAREHLRVLARDPDRARLTKAEVKAVKRFGRPRWRPRACPWSPAGKYSGLLIRAPEYTRARAATNPLCGLVRHLYGPRWRRLGRRRVTRPVRRIQR